MKAYHDILKYILENGIEKKNRTGIDVLSIFGTHFRHDLSRGFPLITTKKLHWRSILFENLWFLHPDPEVSTSNKFLLDNGVTIWKEWQNEDLGLGEIYGLQFRHYPTREGGTIDQVRSVIETLKKDPNNRRMVINAWNVDTINRTGPYFSGACALPPCHMQIVFNVTNRRLNGMMTMRSNDIFLGKPYNIAGYALWIELFAHLTGLIPGELIINVADCHLYINHVDQAVEQLSREPFSLPQLKISKELKDIDDIYNDDGSVNADWFELVNYQHHPHIKAKVSV